MKGMRPLPSGGSQPLRSPSKTAAWPCPWEAGMGPEVVPAPSLSLCPAGNHCSPLTYLLSTIYYVLWGTVGKGGCPWSSLSGKAANTEQVISDGCF